MQTLHNYRLFCANYSLFREGQVCEDCLGKFFPWPGIVHGCYRESKTGTAVVAMMQFVHRVMHTWENTVDQYITLTEFARRKFIQANLPESKLTVKPNFIYPDPGEGKGQGKYALFMGRLSPEKGIEILLKAWEKVGKQIPLKIVGDGSLASRVAETCQKLPNMEWLGKQSQEQVLKLMKESQVLVFPSLWYEGFPMVIVESYAVGLPVIASNLGGLSLIVNHGRTGLHFHPGDPEDLATQVDWILTHPNELVKMRREARFEFEAKYTAEKNYQMLMEIYSRVLSCKK